MIRHFFLFAAAPGRQEEAERALCEWLASSKQFPQFLGGAVLRARAGELGDMPPPLAVTYDVKSREEGNALKAASKSIPDPMSEDMPGIEDQGHVLFGGCNGHDHGSHGHHALDHHDDDHDHGHSGHEEGHAHLEVSSEAPAKLRFDRGGGLLARLGIRGILEGAFMPHSHDAADKVDTALESSERGIWAVKVSLIILGVTTALQGVVVALSGSVALLADTIHNFGDAMTAVPLWTAFALSRRPPTKRYTYGFHRSEDIAGVLVVGLIAFSAAVAADQAIDRLLHPQPITELGWVMAAGILGFVGNEVVAVFRIRVGKEIGSAALIADGYHARTDGFTSLAVVIGAAGVYLGWPMADPIVGLAITIAILGIVWQSAREILQRIMDGVEPEIVERLVKAALLYGVRAIKNVRVRWLGHQLEAELVIAVDGKLSTQASHGIAEAVKRALVHAEPKLRSVLVCVHPQDNNPQAKAELQPPALNPRTEGDL